LRARARARGARHQQQARAHRQKLARARVARRARVIKRAARTRAGMIIISAASSVIKEGQHRCGDIGIINHQQPQQRKKREEDIS